jgi:ubiquinone/menaquinone biosynthesis C-methylase UbiE
VQRARLLARTECYRRLGYDRLSAAQFVAGAGRPAVGPVLDVGTGKGLLAIALAARYQDVVSVDVSREEQALAAFLAAEHGLANRIRFVLADAAVLPFPDASFGSCAMMDVLHHVKNGELVLGEMARVLKPGKLMVVADFTAAGFDLVARVHAEDGLVHNVGPVTMEWAEAYLAGLGLRAGGTREGEFQRVSIFRRPGGGQD